MHDKECLLKLNPSIDYHFLDSGSIVAKVKRGESVTRFTINQAIYEFLQRFKEPRILGDVAREMADEGYSSERVLDLGENLMKTPLIDLYRAGSGKCTDVPALLHSMGYQLDTAFKHRKFDGVFKVSSHDGQPLILKMLHTPDDSVYETTRQRLINEYEILKLLEPVRGVVDVHHFGDGPAPYFAMSFIEGTQLHRRDQRDLGTSLGMCRQVAFIVERIHRFGVIHGDLHTSNFIRDSRNQVSLIDFDCSFRIDGDYKPRNGGAIHFLPPERVIGSWHERVMQKADMASDIYQAAVVIYAVLTDDMPYRGKTLSELSAQIRTGKFRPLASTRHGERIPKMIVEFVHCALSPDPGQRPRSMDEFPHEHP